ncbi:MAG: heme biosynthesis HemY N-terminal domain-containing protein [Paracoccus sp. (in: a-proteobacteria)]|nr:heme biosynthesis HemY N-terminal domain-containing protein [Paracoccus sp. (in: a-proteobacteria)]
MLKILMFFAVVLAIALGLNQLAVTGEALSVTFAGTQYTLGPVQALVALLVFMVISWLVLRVLGLFWALLRFLAGDETSIDRYFGRQRERKGYKALSEGLLAIAAGEGRVAQEKAAQAEKYLTDRRVTNLLAAQAAEVAGDSTTADQVYRKLLEDDATRFVGVRGLMRQKLAEGDDATALRLAEKAYALKPRHEEVQETLLRLQTEQGDWKGARTVLRNKRKLGDLPQDVHMRRDAVLALKEASEVLAHENSISAREAAISANRASPDLIPAAVLAARSYIAQKDLRNAARVLEKTWSVRPHPDIAAAYAEIAPAESAADRLLRFEALMRRNPDDEETRLLRAELLLAAEDFPAARRALGDLATTHPTVRSLAIMAAVERGEGADDAAVRGWLVRALNASRGPQWVCDKCEHVMPEWAPVCSSCHGFDTLSWREPVDAPTAPATPNGAELLPLIVGRPAGSEAHVQAAFDEADAYAEGAPDTARHIPAPVLAPAAAPPRATEVPKVAPGMVPREEDYDSYAPSSTVTDAEIVPEAPVEAEDAPVVVTPPPAHFSDPVPDRGGPRPVELRARPAPEEATDEDEIVMVRPDVEPLDEDEKKR